MDHLLSGAHTEAASAGLPPILRQIGCGSFALGFLGRGGMPESDGRQTVEAIFSGHSGGDLQETLGADQVGLEAGTERIAAPSHAGGVETGTAQQRIVQDGAKGLARGQLGGDGAADDSKDIRDGNPVLRKEPIGSSPIVELRTGSSEQAGHGVASQTE